MKAEFKLSSSDIEPIIKAHILTVLGEHTMLKHVEISSTGYSGYSIECKDDAEVAKEQADEARYKALREKQDAERAAKAVPVEAPSF